MTTLTVTAPGDEPAGVTIETVLSSRLVTPTGEPPMLMKLTPSLPMPGALTVTVVPPARGPEVGLTMSSAQSPLGLQNCAALGTATLATTGMSVAPSEVNRRLRVIASSNFGRPRTRSPFLSSSLNAIRIKSSSSGASVASWTILASSATLRLPSASRQTMAAVRLSRCAVWVCWS